MVRVISFAHWSVSPTALAAISLASFVGRRCAPLTYGALGLTNNRTPFSAGAPAKRWWSVSRVVAVRRGWSAHKLWSKAIQLDWSRNTAVVRVAAGSLGAWCRGSGHRTRRLWRQISGFRSGGLTTARGGVVRHATIRRRVKRPFRVRSYVAAVSRCLTTAVTLQATVRLLRSKAGRGRAGTIGGRLASCPVGAISSKASGPR